MSASVPEKARRALVAALREAGTWERPDYWRYALSNGGTRLVGQRMRELIDAGRVIHYPKTDETPERWEAARR